MSRVISVGDMRRLEQAAVNGGDSYAALMKRAGEATFEAFSERFGASAVHVAVLCGSGNNGGDGFVTASLLATRRAVRVSVLLMDGEPTAQPAASVFSELPQEVRKLYLPTEEIASFLDEELSNVSHVVDAVYGIGFHGTLSAAHRETFSWFSKRRCPVLAVDVPSGMNADSGMCDPYMLRPDVTVTFTANKPCAVLESARTLLGETIVASVGIDELLCASYETELIPIDEELVRATMPRRVDDSHKGTYGSLLSVCGSYGMAGAALLAGKAALRSGVGLLHMALPSAIYSLAAGALWEAVYHPLPNGKLGSLDERSLESLGMLAAGKTAVLVGCGLSTHEDTRAMLHAWLPTLSVPAVLDADGLNLMKGHILLLKASEAPLILTPHPAEAARLLDQTTADVERDRMAAVKSLSEQTGAVVVLKGHRTLVASPGGAVYVNETGCSGLATGGSGDVLSGMIASFAAQGVEPLHAALCGVYLHGAAAEMTAARLSETGMMPTDLLEDLACLLSQFEMRE
ncbi:MAG: NAD(P)H-hydrate dehydratase [Clostridia bacterium]|nr:NAD(P)H-hydrate dehydratase [Clostridia bacterium]